MYNRYRLEQKLLMGHILLAQLTYLDVLNESRSIRQAEQKVAGETLNGFLWGANDKENFQNIRKYGVI